MPTLSNLFRIFTAKRSVCKSQVLTNSLSSQIRSYTDKSKADVTSKHVTQGATENEERVRVRRARPADVPRVLRFVREHARSAWPGIVVPPSVSHIVLCDYVARALSQGHSMVAEQSESRRGVSNIRGLALSTSVCPWDATMLEKWASCVRCTRSRRLMHITAHCLRAPALHDKYRVHNILQVVLIVPPMNPKSTEIIQILAKNAIQRGRDIGYPVVRFDVTDAAVGKSLEDLQLKKEWQLSFDVFPGALRELESSEVVPTSVNTTRFKASKVEESIVKDQSQQEAVPKDLVQQQDAPKDQTQQQALKLKTSLEENFITVYTAFPNSQRTT